MILRSITRLSQTSSEPITLSEAKESLRIPIGQTIDDDYIKGLISAAREQAEQFIDRAICRASFLVVYDVVSGDRFHIKYPASSVEAVTYRDYDKLEVSPAFEYDSQLNELFFSESLSGTGLKITLTTGDVSHYPESLKQAIKLIVGDLYTGRTSAELTNKAAMMLLMPFKNRPII